MRVIATALLRDSDLDSLKAKRPDAWRTVRRFNLPVKLAVLAALDVADKATDRSRVKLISITPCQNGSPAVYEWARRVTYEPSDKNTRLRVNPAHTLHGVDNLGLSAMAIALENHHPGFGLGGAAGQAWEGLELSLREDEGEVLLFAGDQESSREEGPALGVALLLSNSAAGASSIESVRWDAAEVSSPSPHSARGLAALIDVLTGTSGSYSHRVADRDGDGINRIVVEGVAR
ncbi:MAG: hypothetical protein GY811_23255 [Myxococcales bacterium]|nr:hypothetical protein [Myxococcales bacterium]